MKATQITIVKGGCCICRKKIGALILANFRYHRMTYNTRNWKRPHGGRLGVSNDYVGKQGFGFEDWNFANDVWNDGNYHLYLKQTPEGFENGEHFNFVLGIHAQPVTMCIGFVENAKYGISTLTPKALRRRAEELFALNEVDGLGSDYGGKSVEMLKERLSFDAESFNISVAPDDLHILSQPIPIPIDIYEVTFPGYRALSMTEREYGRLKSLILKRDTETSVDQDGETSFPEGAVVESWHRSRERNQSLVKRAKERFIHENGSLFCESCGLRPEQRYDSTKMRNKFIEAHHDVPLADAAHKGQTKVSELKMLCPNCHRAIHSIRPWLTVDKLSKRIK